MHLNNPFSAADFDMQDIRGDDYAVFKPVRNILRLEGLIYLVMACSVYQSSGFSWTQFGLLFFVPEIAIFAYVFANERVGMYFYNVTHSSAGAALLCLFGLVTHDNLYLQIGLIWFSHIGFDRALGYGLKYPMGFRITHLGVLKGMAKKE